MRRGISLIVGVCLLLSMAILPGVPVAKAEAATNLISNGTFEKDVEGFPGWAKYNDGNTTFT